MERAIYQRILEILLAEIESPKEEITDPRKFFAEEAKKIVDKYRISLGWLPDVSWYKILYHAERDLVGFGKIDPLMRDPNIEDISCDGVKKPVYIWHRNFESIETNLQFESDEDLDNLLLNLFTWLANMSAAPSPLWMPLFRENTVLPLRIDGKSHLSEQLSPSENSAKTPTQLLT